jgi:hypothetical protein
MGKTWKNSAPILPSKDYYSFTGGGLTDFSDFGSCFIDFPTVDCGYLIIGVSTTMGSQNTRDMFKTTDGGKTWSYMKSNIESPGYQILNMHFTDTKVG